MMTKLHSVKKRSYKEEMKSLDGGDKKHYPRITFDFNTFPAAKGWKNGNKYRIVIEGEQVGMRDNEGGGHIEIAIEKIGGELSTKRYSRRK